MTVDCLDAPLSTFHPTEKNPIRDALSPTVQDTPKLSKRFGSSISITNLSLSRELSQGVGGKEKDVVKEMRMKSGSNVSLNLNREQSVSKTKSSPTLSIDRKKHVHTILGALF